MLERERRYTEAEKAEWYAENRDRCERERVLAREDNVSSMPGLPPMSDGNERQQRKRRKAND